MLKINDSHLCCHPLGLVESCRCPIEKVLFWVLLLVDTPPPLVPQSPIEYKGVLLKTSSSTKRQ